MSAFSEKQPPLLSTSGPMKTSAFHRSAQGKSDTMSELSVKPERKNTPAWASKAECSPRPLGHPSGFKKRGLLVSPQWVGTQAMLGQVETSLLNLWRDPQHADALEHTEHD